MATSTFELTIKPRSGWQPVDWRELWLYRELLGFLIWRDIKIRYKQTMLGGLWAILQPLIGMVVFGLLFNRVANFRGGNVPYALFVFAGLVPWTFFSNAVALSSASLIGSEQMIRKVYFPRVLVPLGGIGALGLDLLISLVFTAGLMVFFRWPVTSAIFWLPLLMLGLCMSASGFGLILSALNVQYRDVKYIVGFFTQMAFFVTPVIYPATYIPTKYRLLLALNPMSGIVEGFRCALLGSPADWTLIWIALVESLLLFVTGIFFFRRMEHTFADII
jgi:lipopolysaccharide transport system permease protein